MNIKLLTGLTLGLALCACVSTPQPNAALESAHAAVRAAESDPNVGRYAALDLEAARKDLAIADDAALHHREAAIASTGIHGSAKCPPRANARGHEGGRCASGGRPGRAGSDHARDAQSARCRTPRWPQPGEWRNEALEQRDQAANATQANQEAARACKRRLEQLKATPTPRGLVLTLGDVLFDTGRRS